MAPYTKSGGSAPCRTLAFRYALFFFGMAAANEVVWRTQSTVTWGFFKFPGAPLLIFAFVATQMPLLMKHAQSDTSGGEKDS